jgi:hypothetical protein
MPRQCEQLIGPHTGAQRHQAHGVVRVWQKVEDEKDLINSQVCRLPAALAYSPHFDEPDWVNLNNLRRCNAYKLHQIGRRLRPFDGEVPRTGNFVAILSQALIVRPSPLNPQESTPCQAAVPGFFPNCNRIHPVHREKSSTCR